MNDMRDTNQPMKTLLLLRHAKSSWDDITLDDHDRPLNKRGRKAAQAVGNWVREKALVPDEVLCSTAKRTVETWERLDLTAAIRIVPGLYHSMPDTMLRHIMRSKASRLLVIAHNPGMAALADQLLKDAPKHPRFFDYPTASLTVASFEISAWSELTARSGECLEFVVPADLT